MRVFALPRVRQKRFVASLTLFGMANTPCTRATNWFQDLVAIIAERIRRIMRSVAGGKDQLRAAMVCGLKKAYQKY